MTSSYPETDNFGLTRVGEGETLAKDGFSVTDQNVVNLDRILKALADHEHTGGSRLANPALAPELTLATTGGTLPAGQTYYYLISYEDQYGLETAASPEVSITTPAPMGVPTAPALGVETTGGALVAGTYLYVLAARSEGGGLTTTSPVSSIQVTSGTTNRILISLPDIPDGAEALVIYRLRPGQSQYYYWAESTTGADLYDDGTVAEDPTVLAPAYNSSAGTNAVTVEIPGGVLPAGVARWRIYRTSEPGIYNGLNLVHLVSEGETEGDPLPRTDWVDDGSPLLRGQPRRVSSTMEPPPTVPGAVAAGGTVGQVLAKVDDGDYATGWIDSSDALRRAQERDWSVSVPGTLVIGKVYAANPNLFHNDDGTVEAARIVPRWMWARYQDAPTVDANGAQVGFELVGTGYDNAGDELPAAPGVLGFGGAQDANWVGPRHLSVTIEAEDTPLLPAGRIVADSELASSSSGPGKAARISEQNELVDFVFDGAPADGAIPARPFLQPQTMYYIKVILRDDGFATPTDDLRVSVIDTTTSTTLIEEDYTVLPLTSTADDYYQIVFRITTPEPDTPPEPDTITVRVKKMLVTPSAYLIDRVEVLPMPVAIGGSPIQLRACLVDSPNFPIPAVAFPTGDHFVVPPRVYTREDIETSVDFDFWTSDFSSVSWTISSDQAWCVPTPASGTGSTGTITATVDDTGFAAGSRNVATLTLEASGYPDATIEVVTLMKPADLGADASVLIRYVDG